MSESSRPKWLTPLIALAFAAIGAILSAYGIDVPAADCPECDVCAECEVCPEVVKAPAADPVEAEVEDAEAP